MLEHVQRMARYNVWANGRLYDSCAALPEDEYQRPRRAFFGSIHGTLCHVLVADRLWLGRIEGRPVAHRLDDRPYATLAELRAAREAEDARIVLLCDGLEPAALRREVDYRTSSGEPQRTRLDLILLHMFNHQTHHRGQVHDQLSQTELPPPPLDLMYHLRETA